MSAPKISDHALLRYLERARGVEVEALRAELSGTLAAAHASATRIGGGRYQVLAGGLCYVVRGDVVVTVIPRKTGGEAGTH